MIIRKPVVHLKIRSNKCTTKKFKLYDLYSFAKALEESVKDGYKVLDETIYYPQVIGTTFLATVGKELSKETPKQTEEGILAGETKSQFVNVRSRM